MNETLQKMREWSKCDYVIVYYTLFGSISAFFTKQADVSILLPQKLNLLIRVAKLVDQVVIGLEILKHWQHFKVHEMSIARYLGSNKIDLLKKEVESLTEITFKAVL